MDAEQALQIMLEHDDWFSTMNNLILWILRFIGWWLLRGIMFLAETFENAVNFILQNLDFFGASEIGLGDSGGGFYQTYKPIFWALLMIGILIIAFLLITNRLEKKSQTLTNLFVCLLLVFGMPTLLSSLNTIVKLASPVFQSNESVTSYLYRANVTDLLYLDDNGFSPESMDARNNFPDTVPPQKVIDPVEQMDPNGKNTSIIFENKVVYGWDGTATLYKASSGHLFGSLFTTYYYRYQINWFTLFVTGIALVLVFAITGVKIGVIIFNIAYTGIFALFITPLDLSTGQRTKKIVSELVTMFGSIIAILFAIQLFAIGMSWIAVVADGLAMLLLQVGFGIAMLNGPNIVAKVMGVNIGIGQELMQIAGAAYMGKAVAGAAMNAGKKVVGAAGKVAGAAGLGAAGVAGFGKESLSQLKQNGQPEKGKTETVDATLAGGALGGDTGGPNQSSIGLPEHNAPDKQALPEASNPQEPGGSGGAAEMDGTGNAVQGGQGTSPINNDGVTDVEYSEVGSGTPQAQTSAASGDVPMSDTNGSSHAPHPLTSFERNGINSEDTLPSALRKAVANTRPVRKAESYKNQLGVAYNIGKNTAREQMPTLPKPPPVDTYVVNVVEPKPQNSSTATGAPLLPGNNTLVNPDE